MLYCSNDAIRCDKEAKNSNSVLISQADTGTWTSFASKTNFEPDLVNIASVWNKSPMSIGTPKRIDNSTSVFDTLPGTIYASFFSFSNFFFMFRIVFGERSNNSLTLK